MVDLSKSAWYAPPLDWTVRDAELIAALARLVEQKPTRGFGKCCLSGCFLLRSDSGSLLFCCYPYAF
jgi:hypothetical protein